MQYREGMRLRDWRIARDENDSGVRERWFEAVRADAVPCEIPSVLQQTFPEYHGTVFYWSRFRFRPDRHAPSDRILLSFGGVDYKADVWLNGIFLGSHEGGETPFSFDVTGKLEEEGENLLAVRCVNPAERDIDGLNIVNVPNRNKTLRRRAGSSFNHGGLWYDVTLNVLPAVRIEDSFLIGEIPESALSARITVRNDGGETEASLSLRVCEAVGDRPVASIAKTLPLPAGTAEIEMSLPIPDLRLWDVNDPFLYRVETGISSSFGEHSRSGRFGFRDFRVKDGWFTLNGRKLLVKSAHSGNAFPAGMMFPADPSMTRQDLYYAKSCGFNMIRTIAGLFRPEQLDFCDEIGLMIYEECFASWCLGGGWIDAGTVGDETAMLRRYDSCTEEMIRRDRNHPCVTVWGLLNENADNAVFRHAAGFLARARELDPSRLILLNSGRFDNDPSLGSLSNPGGSFWEQQWGKEGGEGKLAEGLCASQSGAGDFHAYPTMPMDENAVRQLRELGKDAKPVFLSEFGTGSLFDVRDEWQHFRQSGFREDLEDADWLRLQSEMLERDWKRFGLETVYPDAGFMLRESQRLNADARYRDFNVLRSNPRLCGLSLTGLLDHGMCGEGFWTYWRRMKPGMFDVLSDGWAPLRFCLFVKSHVYRGEPLFLEAVLADDGVLKAGEYEAGFALVGRQGTAWSCEKRFTVTDGMFSVPILAEEITPDLEAGEYRFTAFLRDGGAPAGCGVSFTVSEKSRTVPLTRKLCAVGVRESTAEHLSSLGVAVGPLSPGTGCVLVGKSVSEDELDGVLKAAEDGAKVIFLSPELFAENPGFMTKSGLPADVRLTGRRDWLYHKECVTTPGTVFGDFGTGLVDFPCFGGTFPRFEFEMDGVPDRVICPAFYTGFHEFADGYGAAHAIFGSRRGRGILIFNCFGIEGQLDREPAAGLLLKGLIDCP